VLKHGNTSVLRLVITGFLRGEQSNFTLNSCNAGRISSNGVLQIDGQYRRGKQRTQQGYKAGEILALVACGGLDPPSAMFLRVYAPNRSPLRIVVFREVQKVWISVGNTDEKDLEGLALMEALLTGGFGLEHNDAWSLATVTIGRRFEMREMDGIKLTRAALKAQMAPLFPLVVQHANWDIDAVGF
jgi:hypothetical protein